MHFPPQAALWFLPFVLPLCYVVALTDLRSMRIPNWTVDTLALIYIILGLLVMPTWADYGWQLLHLPGPFCFPRFAAAIWLTIIRIATSNLMDKSTVASSSSPGVPLTN